MNFPITHRTRQSMPLMTSRSPLRLLLLMWAIIGMISAIGAKDRNAMTDRGMMAHSGEQVPSSSSISSLPIEQQMKDAEDLVRQAFAKVWQWKAEAGIADTMKDSLRTGMIGEEWTPLTTTLGNEEAKWLSVQPGWAGFLVKELSALGVKSGDTVAISMTGSFPALNLATLVACQTLGLAVVSISSLGSSQYGANQPGFTWPEIEYRLRQEGFLHLGTTLLTFGGTGDRGAEWSEEARQLAEECALKTPWQLLKPHNLRQAIRMRLLHYGDLSRYKCFINIGGNQATLGGGARQRYNRGGWFYKLPPGKSDPAGVIDYFLQKGIPCLNLLHLEELNQKFRIVNR
ncbi:MAG: poly-gamma-glutamate system protein [bacterium]